MELRAKRERETIRLYMLLLVVLWMEGYCTRAFKQPGSIFADWCCCPDLAGLLWLSFSEPSLIAWAGDKRNFFQLAVVACCLLVSCEISLLGTGNELGGAPDNGIECSIERKEIKFNSRPR